MKKPIQDEVVKFRIDSVMFRKLRQAAQAENRTISNWLRNLVQKALEAQ